MKRKIEGPRRATRWIGEALVLDGDLTKGAPAVWRGGKEPKCARVRHEDVSRDWEFGVDEAEVHLAASLLAGPAIVPRLATYADDEVETVIVVEEDIAGVSLRELIAALATAGGEVPAGLVAYVGREIVRALSTAGDVRVQLNPRSIDVAWDGRVSLRPLVDPADIEDLVYGDDAIENVAYRADEREPHSLMRVLGMILFELVAGRHPYRADSNDDDDDDAADALLERRERGDRVELDGVVGALIERFLEADGIETVDEAAPALDELRDDFDAAALAGMLRGLFPGRKERDDDEREDRLQVLPGPKVEPEEWKILDSDLLGRDTAGYETVGLADVLADPVVRRGYARSLEPSVPPIDPFDDE
jgi:hypothetical protein